MFPLAFSGVPGQATEFGKHTPFLQGFPEAF